MATENTEEPVLEPVPQRGPGEQLARARENAGIDLRTMADTLHLPEGQVWALEQDDYASLPPPTFVRGYLRSYARVVGLDDDDMVAAYDALDATTDDPALRLSGGRDASAQSRGLALALVVLALAVALSVGAWWWQAREAVPTASLGAASDATAEAAASDEDSASPERDAAAASNDDGGDRDPVSASARDDAEAMAASGPGGDAADPDPADDSDRVALDEDAANALGDEALADGLSGARTGGNDTEGGAEEVLASDANATASSGAADATRTPADRGAADAEQAADDDAGENVATAETEDQDAGEGEGEATTAADYEPPTQTASATAATSPQAAEGPERLQLHVDGRSWIEVYDARGRELVYTLYTGSEPLRLRGWPPFDVFLGNSPAVAVDFNDTTVGKSAFTRSDRTARFLVDGDGARRR